MRAGWAAARSMEPAGSAPTRRPFAMVLAPMLMLGACAGVPSEDLRAYADAYDRASEAGRLIYAEMVPAASAASPAETGPDDYLLIALGPPEWQSGDCAEFAGIEELVVRCHALQAIAEYNQLLLRFDAGESVDLLQGRIRELFGLVDGVAGLAGATPAAPIVAGGKAAFAALSRILGAALELRERAALLERLNEGAPHVAELIALLQADIPEIYRTQRNHHAFLLAEQHVHLLRSATAMIDVALAHGRPEAAELIAAQSALARRYEAALAMLDERPAQLARLEESFAVGGRPFGWETVSALENGAPGTAEGGVKAVESRAAEYVRIRGDWRSFVAALTAYQDMLNAVDASLATLVARSNDPLAPGGGTAAAVAAATSVRENAAEIRRLLRQT